MKRIYEQVVAVLITLFIPIAVSMPVAAAPVCEIGFTGPDSNNMCVSQEKYNCSVVNENNVTISNSTNQTVASGEVTVSGNGSGGSATSGSVSNEEGTVFTVVIKNGGGTEQKPDSCMASVVVPAIEPPVTPEKPEVPKEPGRGGATTPVQPAKAVTPAALPVTSAGKAPVLALTGSLVISVAAAYAYRRFVS